MVLKSHEMVVKLEWEWVYDDKVGMRGLKTVTGTVNFREDNGEKSANGLS
jgi:hypothetical protein